jgi:hypothetical protein
MKRLFFYIMASAAVWLTACTVEGTYTGEITPQTPEPELGKVKITVYGLGIKTISMAGSGMIEIDWGDGSQKDKRELSSSPMKDFGRQYSSVNEKTITITGENITHLHCNNVQVTGLDLTGNPKLKELQCFCNELTELNVSQNTELKNLFCSFNQLTSLKVDKNTKLAELYCNDNKLTNLDVKTNTELIMLDLSTNKLVATALNNLFGTLHDRNIGGVEGKSIYIANNDGTGSCLIESAEDRKWKVNTEAVRTSCD